MRYFLLLSGLIRLRGKQMPKLTSVLTMTDANQLTFPDALMELCSKGQLTRTQWLEIMRRVLPLLPGNVMLQMRSPKGVVFVLASSDKGVLSFTLDHRAKEK